MVNFKKKTPTLVNDFDESSENKSEDEQNIRMRELTDYLYENYISPTLKDKVKMTRLKEIFDIDQKRNKNDDLKKDGTKQNNK